MEQVTFFLPEQDGNRCEKNVDVILAYILGGRDVPKFQHRLGASSEGAFKQNS